MEALTIATQLMHYGIKSSHIRHHHAADQCGIMWFTFKAIHDA
jgi:hypothetical protein